MDMTTIRDAVEEYDNFQGEIDSYEEEQQCLDTSDDNYDEDLDHLQSEIDGQEEDQCVVNDSLKASDSMDIDTARDWVEAADASPYSDGVFEAAYECDVHVSQVQEAYSGEFKSNEEFAQDMADQVGSSDDNTSWPNGYIDWERAASDLMMDYCEDNGYYFRNL